MPSLLMDPDLATLRDGDSEAALGDPLPQSAEAAIFFSLKFEGRRMVSSPPEGGDETTEMILQTERTIREKK